MKKITSFALNALLFLHCLLLFLIVFETSVKVPFWLQPLGRMHPILLHFPVAFVVLLALLNTLKKQLDEHAFNKINLFLLLITAITTALATLMGFLLSLEGYESQLMNLHKWAGIVLCFLIYSLVLLRKQKIVYQTLLYIGLIGIVLVGHYGAGLTHGKNFITEPLLAAKTKKIDESTPVYSAYIKPILNAKCVSCHNPEKRKGALDLSTIEGITKGGKNGPLWVAHKPENSQFMQRAQLPINDKEHMPPEGKPQLTPLEIELLETWILQGANNTISFAQLKPEAPLKKLIEKKWQKQKASTIPKYTFEFADAKLVESLNSSPYRTVIQKSSNSPAIDVSIYGESTYSLKLLTDLSEIKEQIVFLNVAKLPVDNKALEFIGTLNNLEHLILNGTDVKNNDLQALKTCLKLQSISLSSTKVNASVLSILKNFKNLKEVFLWNTPITSNDLAVFEKELPLVTFYKGYVSDTNTLANLTPPILEGNINVINSGDRVKIWHKMNGVKIHYTDNGDKPDSSSTLLNSDLKVMLDGKKFKTIKTIAYKNGWKPSSVKSFTFLDKGFVPKAFELEYEGILGEYTGSAKRILLDNVVMNNNKVDVSKFWAGFQEKPLIAIADFGKTETPNINEVILSVGYSFYQNRIKHCPVKYVELWISNDKQQWKLAQRKNYENTKNLEDIKNISLKVPNGKYQYYKIVAQPNGIKMHVDQLFFY
ncbi:hypothetical protein FUA26_09025 [Seonamhaeicola algicola]|uniref:Uncharacterized protein n=1 Tax=Seonamhaeicola algicola TaxID=1719036 RepID=A0A5C7ALN8_9FLAO|nr:c-type cytochrome domain-containing protein [Seonamhaeicola algicola]TXE09620.1 hypothetical protein FUA26_09025 [Seonamhaeicola algicola]